MKYQAYRISSGLRFLSVALAVFSVLTLLGCAPSVKVTVNPDGSGVGSFTGSLGTASASVISRITGEESPLSAVDAQAITTGLRTAGMISDAVVSVSGTSLSIDFAIPSLDGLFDRAITLGPTGRRMALTLSRESVNSAIALMTPETRDSQELLMAPVFTGESLSLAEYEEIMAATYGKSLADELRRSVFVLSVECPDPVRTVSIPTPGTAAKTDKTARFAIPLSVLLVMETPITLVVTW